MTDHPGAVNEFSGEAENVFQVGTVRGDVHVHHTRRAGPVPRQLPLNPSGFVNREADLRRLDRMLAALDDPGSERRMSATVSTVAGAPGVGKTALAVHWAHRVRDRFPDGDLYINLQGYGLGLPLSPEHALDAFLRALEVPSEAVPETVEERAALFRSLVDGKRVLLVIDNAASSSQVRQLLPASPRCVAVVTSRSVLQGLAVREGATRVTLDLLSSDDSVRLLSELIGAARVEAERSMAARVAELCGHLPIALRVVAERAAGRPGLSMTELAEELMSERRRLDGLALDEDELCDTRAVFSWSYSALPQASARTFRLLGLHAGPEVGVEAAAALIEADAAEARRRLRALADVHLLQETGAGRFRLHDLLRSYAQERVLAEESQESRTQAVRRVLTWYLLTTDLGRRAILPYAPSVPLVPRGGVRIGAAFDDSAQALRWFGLERLNLLAALRQASELGQFDIAWKLAMTTTGFFELQSYWSDWEENHRIGLAAARVLGDPLGEAANLLMLADAGWRRGSSDEADGNYRVAARIARDAGVGWAEGFALRGLGLVREEAEQPVGAIKFFQSALSVFRASGHRRGEGMSLLSLGKCARAVGDLNRAVAHGAEAVAIFAEINDTWSTAWGRLALAPSLTDLGRTAEATDQLRQAAETFRVFEDPQSETMALVLLVELLREAGNLPAAEELWERAAELLDALDDSQSAEFQARLERLRPDQ